MKKCFLIFLLFLSSQIWGQIQTCPVNINYSYQNLTHWFAYTGTFQSKSARQHLAIINYDSTSPTPAGTINAISIPEYGTSTAGLEVQTNKGVDPFGGFETIPTINGYDYKYSIKVGSSTINTAPDCITTDQNLGGLFRGLAYTINVPPGLVTQPYVVTYAYAMVLESAPHENNQVPMFSAQLNTNSGIINCASALYLLPTTPVVVSRTQTNYVLDQAAALQEGFTQSNVPSPNNNCNANETKYRVWSKGWTEVIFDLAPYRGQQVTLTFEADNCVPKGHFAYAYVAVKDVCQGLEISGTSQGCANTNLTYAIPQLAGATYQWTIPNNWKFLKDSANTITVLPDSTNGVIVANATNSCADLKANITVNIASPTIPGNVSGDSVVCLGVIPNQNFPIQLNNNRGQIVSWLSSTDYGNQWTPINDTNNIFIAKNINITTQFRALVQNGNSCSIDSSNIAQITINKIPIAGKIIPDSLQTCLDQPLLNALTLNGSMGSIYNWQQSSDKTNWINSNTNTSDTVQSILGIQGITYFRAIVSNKACPADTSNIAMVGIFNSHFPQANIAPSDTSICFETLANLSVTINYGTNYQWLNSSAIFPTGDGIIGNTPFTINASAAPSKSTNYIIAISNAGCPNILYDTIHVNVDPAMSVYAGKDTTVLMNQPLQLNALLSDNRKVQYLWTPAAGLNFTNIANPIVQLDGNPEFNRYTVSVVDSLGCTASSSILVDVLKIGPVIYVPSGFTPNADGKNDVLRPKVYGITQQYFFSVYNRWGQQLFYTTEINKGWDGNFNGVAQPSGAYVFIAEGIDFLGKKQIKTGTAVLIR